MITWLKTAVLVFCLFPVAQLGHRAYGGDLGVNPIDTITRFIDRSTVLTVVEDNPKDKNHAGLKRNLELLQRMKIEDGTDLQVVPLPMPQPIVRRNQWLPASYANFYISNKVVLLPTFDDPADEKAFHE